IPRHPHHLRRNGHRTAHRQIHLRHTLARTPTHPGTKRNGKNAFVGHTSCPPTSVDIACTMSYLPKPLTHNTFSLRNRWSDGNHINLFFLISRLVEPNGLLEKDYI